MDIKNSTAKARVEYTYGSSGEKLRVKKMWNPDHTALSDIGSGVDEKRLTKSKTTDYIGNKIYEDSQLKSVLVDGGYYDVKEKKYYFYEKDHQGNNRVVLDESGKIVQTNDYYPFGKLFFESSGQEKQPYRYNGKELDSDFGLDLYDYHARQYDPTVGSFTSMDPLSEKYYSVSPYAYVINNPVNMVDPTGMDIYRYDNKTGEFHLEQETNENFDQVGKFKYDKKSGEYTLQTNKKGNAKTRIENVEKGILSNGINFMKNNNMIAVGGEGQASVDGVETFIVNLSDMVGREIGGAYFSKDGAESTTHISIGRYENNSLKETKGHGHSIWNRLYPDSKLENSITGFFHTHPSNGNINVSDRIQASKQDKDSGDRSLKLTPHMQFYILTHPVYPGDKFSYKFPYTNAR